VNDFRAAGTLNVKGAQPPHRRAGDSPVPPLLIPALFRLLILDFLATLDAAVDGSDFPPQVTVKDSMIQGIKQPEVHSLFLLSLLLLVLVPPLFREARLVLGISHE
jgi:hypothetical protein